jgi:3'-phosphoadenosine 5'-phosphosulfate sulfotransferase (PAPS reductase)/FAD synthetase
MEHWELKQMQSLPLQAKVIKTQQRIKEWYERYDGNVYVSFSGGKDSTVLLDIARDLYPDIPAVFVDTGLEYPEVKDFVKTIDNVVVLKPKMVFTEVIKKYGYPVISKEQSQFISEVRNCKNKDGINYFKRLNGNKWGRGKISEKWKYLIDAPFKISNKCCSIMKKDPARDYEKASGNHPITGMMASESSKRTIDYLKTGCNAFDIKRPQSQPMGFWTEQDVLDYLRVCELPYASVYGDIVEDESGTLTTTGADRTGCMFCMFGIHLEKGMNRFQRMQTTHPQLWDYCINNLNLKEVLDFIGVPYGRSKVSKAKYKALYVVECGATYMSVV